MADSLVPADATQALVLADAQHERSLALFEGSKRKGQWASSAVPKRGRRWGLVEDKPFKPLPYVDLPVGLSDAEVDQFLREQRLEDLHRKLQLHQLEECDPDIRPPSPPPVYDRAGNRLNTREVRVRKSMLAEYNRLIRYMIKTIEGYEPPLDWRPQKLIKKFIIPYERYPNAQFMGVIIGARGVNHRRLQEVTGCRIFIRGRDVGDKFQTEEELQMPQHVHIEGDTEEQISTAEELLKPLLNPESPEFEYARTHGRQQLATVNGFTLKRAEQRCGICGAIGHLGFECPETDSFRYKMANVVCTICGDKGHVASDCKVTLERHQKENVDWKAQAEKTREMDTEFSKMMNELGIDGPGAPPLAPSGLFPMPPRPQAPGPPRPMPPRARPGLGFPGGPRPVAPPGGAPAPITFVRAGEAPAECAAQGAAAALALALAPMPSGAMSSTAPVSVPPPPWPRPPLHSAPPYSYGQATLPQRPSMMAPYWSRPAPGPLLTPALRPTPPWAVAPPTPAPAPARAPAPAPVPAQGVDEGPVCPPGLLEKFELERGVLEEMCRETGAHIIFSLSAPSLAGERRFVMEGAAEARGRAKLHLQAWLDVNCMELPPLDDVGPALSSPPPFGGPQDGFLQLGFCPEGFPPDGFGAGPSAPGACNGFGFGGFAATLPQATGGDLPPGAPAAACPHTAAPFAGNFGAMSQEAFDEL